MSPPIINTDDIFCFSSLPQCRDLGGRAWDECVWRCVLVIAARVYFIVGLINVLLVGVTLSIFVYYGRPPSTAEDQAKHWFHRLFTYKVGSNTSHDNLAQQMRAHGLQRRGLLTTSLMSLGYLVFSTGMYAYQSFYRRETCLVMFWCVLVGFVTYMFAITWSSYRLTFLSRISILKDRFANGNCGDDQELRWLLRNRDLHAISSRRFLVVYSGLFVLLVAAGICIQIFGGTSQRHRCTSAWGNYVLLSLSCFYFVILLPTMAWSVRKCKDLHGVRNQFFVMFSIGIPFFILYIIWIAVYNPQDAKEPSYVRSIFPAANWLILMTAASHGTLVCWPLIKYTLWAKRMQQSATASRSVSTQSTNDYRCETPELERRATANHAAHAPVASPARDICGQLHWNHGQSLELVLQPECLDAILRDPAQRKQLHAMAVRDFSVENILFYEQYLQLEQEMKAYVKKDRLVSRPASLVVPEPPKPVASPVSRTSRSSQESFHESPLTTVSDLGAEVDQNRVATSSTGKRRKRAFKTFLAPHDFIHHRSPAPSRNSKYGPVSPDRREELLEEPIPKELEPLCEEIYKTFIPEWAPLQVNISHKARTQLECVLADSCRYTDNSLDYSATQWLTHPTSSPSSLPHENHSLLPLAPDHRQRFESNETVSSGRSTATPETLSPDPRSRFTDEARPKQNRERPRGVKLASFEPARQEVFWNIFTSIFPKLVHQN